MSDKIKKNNLLIIITILLITITFISSLFYINIKNNQPINKEATVKLVSNNYIIVLTQNGEEYSLETKEPYNIGDKVSFTIKNIEKDSNPKKGDVIKIDTISKSINFSITDVKEDTNEEAQINTETTPQETTPTTTIDSTTSDNKETTTETDVISYFENLNNKIDTYNQDKSIGASLKSGFITVVDFLFYDGQIKGKTFDELSNTAKIKVLKLAFSIDEKIEKYFPGYKEEISTTGKKVYTTVKSKALELYLDTTTKVCENNSTTCEAAKEGLSDLKDSFSLTWDLIKELSNVGVSKLKAWYEIWKQA